MAAALSLQVWRDFQPIFMVDGTARDVAAAFTSVARVAPAGRALALPLAAAVLDVAMVSGTRMAPPAAAAVPQGTGGG